jgi:hypothetical protein
MLEPARPKSTRRSGFGWKPSVRRRVPHTLGLDEEQQRRLSTALRSGATGEQITCDQYDALTTHDLFGVILCGIGFPEAH